MILSLNVSQAGPNPDPAPLRRRVLVLGATEAGVSAGYHLGRSATLIEQRDISNAGRRLSGKVQRWDPPTLEPMPPTFPATASWDAVWRQMVSLLSGEVRLGSVVTAIDSAEHRLTLASGVSFIYDKLVCTVRLSTLHRLLVDAQPVCVRGPDWWRCWLSGRDIELLDTAAQIACGDVDGEVAGKRIAGSIAQSMRDKYSRNSLVRRHEALFQPRVVSTR